jgi:tetratricopeptide (TPR) repeat protein
LPKGKDGQTRATYRTDLEFDEIAAIVAESDLHDPITRERLEGTIRLQALYAHISAFIVCAAGLSREQTFGEFEKLLRVLFKADFWRRACVRRASAQLLAPSRAAVFADDFVVQETEDGEADFENPRPTAAERREATAALREAGGGELADCLNSSGLASYGFTLAQRLLRRIGMPQFMDLLKRGLTEWPDAPEIHSRLGWCYYELASFKQPGGSYLEAHRAYAQAAALAQAQAGGAEAAKFVWEAANALGRHGGEDGLGTPVGTLRCYAAEAAALDESLVRGIYANTHGGKGEPTQAHVAVRCVVEATRTRLPETLVTKGEYTQLTDEEFRGAVEREKKVVQRRGPKGGGASGPMWIAGRPPPYEGTAADGGRRFL